MRVADGWGWSGIVSDDSDDAGGAVGEAAPVDLRLDAALAARGIVRSRTQAARLIADGSVTIDGVMAVRASTRIRANQVLALTAIDHYVSRAAHKLAAALNAFAIPVEGREGLDVGASTGGFTQVLLERGASRVTALDVGHGQMDEFISRDSRVTVIEGFNARDLSGERLDAAAKRAVAASIVVADLSFISLTTVLSAIATTVGLTADYILLIKPQFEVGRTGIKEGIVHNPGLRAEAISGVLWAAWDVGLPVAGIISSPILGNAGNHEYLVWLSVAKGTNPAEWGEQVLELSK